MENETPSIKPMHTKEYEVKQSKYNMVGKLPTRSILCGPSGAGKGVLLIVKNFIIIRLLIF